MSDYRRTRGNTGGRRPHTIAVAAVAVTFMGAGITMASAVSRMPEIKTRIGATATELAFALVCTGVGSIIAMPLSGRLTARFGTARIVVVFATLASIGWSLIPLAGSVPALAAILLLTGMGIGTWDVAMNVQGSIVERARNQVLMPLWHGLFSVGAVLGALIGAGAAKWHVPLGWHLPILAAALWVCVVVASLVYLPNPGAVTVITSTNADDGPAGPAAASAVAAAPAVAAEGRRWNITRLELLLGIVMLSTAIGEGAANDWLAVALVEERAAPAAIGALALAGFNVTMAIGRFAGGPVIARFGRAVSLRVAGIVAALGVGALCLVPSTAVALGGAAAWGLGLAIVFPSAISAAGEVPQRSSQAIATVSTIGYGGFLFGAPLIGTLAHAVPLLDALLVVAAFAVLIAVLAPVARERRTGEATGAPDAAGAPA